MQKQTSSTKTTTEPRPRRQTTTGPPPGYAKSRVLFENRAHRWLLARPGRIMWMPGDLTAVTGLGVPCQKCGHLIYRDRDRGHRVSWTRNPDSHWAAGVTVTCPE